MRLLLSCLFLITLYVAQAQSSQPYSHSVTTMSDFNAFKGEPLTDKLSQVDAIKVVYVISSGKIYYINDRYAHLHYDFCKQFLNEFDDLALFNQYNYTQNSDRKYILGNINYFHSTGKFALEFSVADDLSPLHIKTLHSAITGTFIPQTELLLFVNTPGLKEKVKTSALSLKIIEPHEIYADQIIQVVHPGNAYGKLKKLKAEEVFTADISPEDILLIDGYSNDIPLCAGVIITTFQTPLSHITILAHNRKTPVVVYKNASTDKKMEEYLDQMVLLSVTDDTFTLSLNERPLGSAKKNKIVKLEADVDFTSLTLAKDIKLNDVEKFGAKACYLAELQRVSGANKEFYTPRGTFGIPFYYYKQHIEKYGIDKMIYALLDDTTLLNDRVKLNEKLTLIRDSILHSPLDTAFYNAVLKTINTAGTGKRPRFRSSSNAEDLAEFNGAGLYESETGIPGDTAKPADRAIKIVWASLWNERAFREREYFGLDQKTIYMGILVHESFPEEICNGVAVTRNLYRDSEAGFVINMQIGETSVVQPPEGINSEWMITYLNMGINFYDDKNSIEYVNYSNLNNNKPILTVEQIDHLSKQLSLIKDHFYTKSKAWMKQNYRDYALDIEFKYVMRNGKPVLLIKQARPYR